MTLFASQGFDATNISAIARQAGVSTRTFLRYFPTKESAFYGGETDWLEALFASYLTQPRTLSDLDALRATLIELAPRVQKSRRLVLLYQRAVGLSLELRGRDQDHQHEITDVLAWAIAARRGLGLPDTGCKLLAGVALVVYRRSLDIWLTGPADADLAVIIDSEFEMLCDQLTS